MTQSNWADFTLEQICADMSSWGVPTHYLTKRTKKPTVGLGRIAHVLGAPSGSNLDPAAVEKALIDAGFTKSGNQFNVSKVELRQLARKAGLAWAMPKKKTSPAKCRPFQPEVGQSLFCIQSAEEGGLQ